MEGRGSICSIFEIQASFYVSSSTLLIPSTRSLLSRPRRTGKTGLDQRIKNATNNYWLSKNRTRRIQQDYAQPTNDRQTMHANTILIDEDTNRKRKSNRPLLLPNPRSPTHFPPASSSPSHSYHPSSSPLHPQHHQHSKPSSSSTQIQIQSQSQQLRHSSLDEHE